MNPMLEQLHDIEGIDPVSPWPLAIGWWVLIAISIIIGLGLVWIVVCQVRYRRSWRRDTHQKLNKLESNLSETTARETVIILSEYLRRIILKRFPRKECAGLMGQAWLKWLATHDSKKFDWETKGAILIEIPYAPMNKELSIEHIKELIGAVRNWVT